MSSSEQLRELHDRYVWKMNAAVGEGRLDVVRHLADQYVDQAAELITEDEPVTCEADRALPDRPVRPVAGSRRCRWPRRPRGSRTS
jgi:hypothetical protein